MLNWLIKTTVEKKLNRLGSRGAGFGGLWCWVCAEVTNVWLQALPWKTWGEPATPDFNPSPVTEGCGTSLGGLPVTLSEILQYSWPWPIHPVTLGPLTLHQWPSPQ